MIARLDRRSRLAHLLHHAAPLVAGHDRQRMLRVARHEVPVAMADARRGDLDQHFTRPRRGEIERFDRRTAHGVAAERRP